MTLDGVVGGQVMSDYQIMNRWPLSVLLLLGFGLLTIYVLLPIFIGVLIAVGFLFALLAAMMVMAGSGLGAFSVMLNGIVTMIALSLRFVFFLLGGAIATSGGGRPPLAIDTTSFRLTDQGGTVYNCIALGRIPAGAVRGGDTLTVDGFIGWDKSVRIRRIVNQRVGTTTRPDKPGMYWVLRACQVVLGLLAIWLFLWFVS